MITPDVEWAPRKPFTVRQEKHHTASTGSHHLPWLLLSGNAETKAHCFAASKRQAMNLVCGVSGHQETPTSALADHSLLDPR